MFDYFGALPHAAQALIAGLFTWAVTAAGAAAVFLLRSPGRRLLDAALGFAAGIMSAAGYFSLLAPAAELAAELGMNVPFVLLAGFLGGGALLHLGSLLWGRLSSRAGRGEAMLVGSVTLHNIPEGLSVGVAFGSLAHGIPGANLGAACLLALGIGIQNFPEGMAVSLPLRRSGMGRARAFGVGQLSGAVEPVSAVIGAALAAGVRPLLPYMLAFASGAMFYAVTAELLPESGENSRPAAAAALAGFALMMVLDVALG